MSHSILIEKIKNNFKDNLFIIIFFTPGRNTSNFSCIFLHFLSNQTQKHKNQMYTKSNLILNQKPDNSWIGGTVPLNR